MVHYNSKYVCRIKIVGGIPRCWTNPFTSSPAAASEDEGSGGENEESGGEDKELSLEQLQAQKAARARYMRFYRSLRSKRAMSAHMQMWGVKDLHN